MVVSKVLVTPNLRQNDGSTVVQSIANTYLLISLEVKRPFLDPSGVNVVGKTLDGFILNSFHVLQHSGKLNSPIESPSSQRTLTGHSLKRGQRIVTFPQCTKYKSFVKLIEVSHE